MGISAYTHKKLPAKLPAKTCPVCNTQFNMRPNESIQNYRNRTCCSKACSNIQVVRIRQGLAPPKTRYVAPKQYNTYRTLPPYNDSEHVLSLAAAIAFITGCYNINSIAINRILNLERRNPWL